MFMAGIRRTATRTGPSHIPAGMEGEAEAVRIMATKIRAAAAAVATAITSTKAVFAWKAVAI